MKFYEMILAGSFGVRLVLGLGGDFNLLNVRESRGYILTEGDKYI